MPVRAVMSFVLKRHHLFRLQTVFPVGQPGLKKKIALIFE
jgi:hypothetical protein